MSIEDHFQQEIVESALQYLSPEEFKELQEAALTQIDTTELDPAEDIKQIIGGLIVSGFLSGMTFRYADMEDHQQGGGPYSVTGQGKVLVPMTPRQMAMLLEITLGGEEE